MSPRAGAASGVAAWSRGLDGGGRAAHPRKAGHGDGGRRRQGQGYRDEGRDNPTHFATVGRADGVGISAAGLLGLKVQVLHQSAWLSLLQLYRFLGSWHLRARSWHRSATDSAPRATHTRTS